MKGEMVLESWKVMWVWIQMNLTAFLQKRAVELEAWKGDSALALQRGDKRTKWIPRGVYHNAVKLFWTAKMSIAQ